MSNIKSSKKRILQSRKKNKFNSSRKSMIKTFINKVNKAILLKDKKQAENEFKKMQKIIDQQVNKGIIHKNKASRNKSKLYFRINSIK